MVRENKKIFRKNLCETAFKKYEYLVHSDRYIDKIIIPVKFSMKVSSRQLLFSRLLNDFPNKWGFIRIFNDALDYAKSEYIKDTSLSELQIIISKRQNTDHIAQSQLVDVSLITSNKKIV